MDLNAIYFVWLLILQYYVITLLDGSSAGTFTIPSIYCSPNTLAISTALPSMNKTAPLITYYTPYFIIAIINFYLIHNLG